MMYLHIIYTILRLFTPTKIILDFIEMSNNFASGSSLLIQIQIAIVGIIIVLGIFFIWRTVSRMEQRLKVVEINQKTLAQCQNMSVNSTNSFNNGDENPMSCPISSMATTSRDPNIQPYSTAIPREFKDIDEFSDEMLKVFGSDKDYEYEEDYEEDSEYDKKATTTAKNIVITPIEIKTKKINDVKPVSEVTVVPTPAITVVPVSEVTVVPTPAINVVPVSEVTVGPVSEVTVGPVSEVTVGSVPTIVNTVYISTSSNSVNLVDDVLTETDSESGNPLSKSKLKAMSVDKLKSICTHHNLSTEGSKNTLVARILGESRD